jgi:hypothetical protein
MTRQDLDRLISRTELNPVNKKALRGVRKAVVSGRVGEPDIRSATWSISIQTDGGYPATMTFSFKRD